MQYLALIQARCGSTRLANKVLMDLGGKPVLQRVIERVQQSKYMDEVMVITSIQQENLQIVELCCQLGIRVFIGSEDDVLDRYYQAAKLIKPAYIVRVTGDCPVYDPQLLDLAIEGMGDADYCADFGHTLPDGLDIEVFKFSALEKAWQEARLQSEREHVTQYIRKHHELFRLADFACPLPDMGDMRWTLDEPEDYQLLTHIYEHFVSKGQEYFYIRDIVDYLDQHKELATVNQAITRDEGLAKSLANDKIVELD